jgi:hypothetical protein
VIRAGCHFRQWWEPRNPRAGRAPCPSQLPLQSITTSLSRLVLRTRHLFRIQLVAADVCGWVDESGLDRWRERESGKEKVGMEEGEKSGAFPDGTSGSCDFGQGPRSLPRASSLVRGFRHGGKLGSGGRCIPIPTWNTIRELNTLVVTIDCADSRGLLRESASVLAPEPNLPRSSCLLRVRMWYFLCSFAEARPQTYGLRFRIGVASSACSVLAIP